MRNVRITWLGVAVLVIVAVALVLGIWGPAPIKPVAGTVIAFVLLFLVAGDAGKVPPKKRWAGRRQPRRRRFDDAP